MTIRKSIESISFNSGSNDTNPHVEAFKRRYGDGSLYPGFSDSVENKIDRNSIRDLISDFRYQENDNHNERNTKLTDRSGQTVRTGDKRPEIAKYGDYKLIKNNLPPIPNTPSTLARQQPYPIPPMETPVGSTPTPPTPPTSPSIGSTPKKNTRESNEPVINKPSNEENKRDIKKLLERMGQSLKQDIKESPQKAKDKEAVDNDGKVIQDKLKESVQQELKILKNNFNNDNRKDDQLSSIDRNHPLYDFKSKYEQFKKDIESGNFNAKEVLDSFNKAYEAAKNSGDTKLLGELDKLKTDLIDKHIVPIDNISRGDQGSALIARNEMREFVDFSLEQLKSRSGDTGVNLSVSALENELNKPPHEQKNIEIINKNLNDEIDRLIASKPEKERGTLELIKGKLNQSLDNYGTMNQIAYSGVVEQNGKASLNNEEGIIENLRAREFFEFIEDSNSDRFINMIDKMQEESDNLFNLENITEDPYESVSKPQAKQESPLTNLERLDENSLFYDEDDSELS